MKRKALLVALVCVMGLAVLSVGTAIGAQGFFTVNVTDVGSGIFGFYTFTATDTAAGGFGTQRFFILQDPSPSPLQKAAFASALTAYSCSGAAIIYADPVSTACWEVRAGH